MLLPVLTAKVYATKEKHPNSQTEPTYDRIKLLVPLQHEYHLTLVNIVCLNSLIVIQLCLLSIRSAIKKCECSYCANQGSPARKP